MNNKNYDAIYMRSRFSGANSEDIRKLLSSVLFSNKVRTDQSKLALENIAESKSQFLQDIAALVFNDGKSNGYFVEVGVGNGVDLSNTHLLEQKYSWKGILVEPNRRYRKQITDSRSAILDIRAAFKTTGQVVVFENVLDDGLHSRIADEAERVNSNVERYDVMTATLTDILNSHAAPTEIDYLSIDVEGAELSVLKGTDFSKFSFGFINIEHNNNRAKRRIIQRIMEENGYKEILPECSGIDSWFVKKQSSHSSLT